MIREGTEVEILFDSGENVSGKWSGCRDLSGRAFVELTGVKAVRKTDAAPSSDTPLQRGPLGEIDCVDKSGVVPYAGDKQWTASWGRTQ